MSHKNQIIITWQSCALGVGVEGNTALSLLVLYTYEEILDISLFFTLILTFSCCILSMANTGDEVIYLHYFDFVNFYKKV